MLRPIIIWICINCGTFFHLSVFGQIRKMCMLWSYENVSMATRDDDIAVARRELIGRRNHVTVTHIGPTSRAILHRSRRLPSRSDETRTTVAQPSTVLSNTSVSKNILYALTVRAVLIRSFFQQYCGLWWSFCKMFVSPLNFYRPSSVTHFNKNHELAPVTDVITLSSSRCSL